MGENFRQFNQQTFGRPDGFKFPVGLTTQIVGEPVTVNVATNSTGGVQTTVGKVFIPIPQSELDVNPNLTQNPGY